MQTLVAGDDLHNQLAELTDRAEIRDQQGNVIGVFTPLAQLEKWAYATAAERFDFTELQRRDATEAHVQGETTAQLLQRLGPLEDS